MTSLSSPVVEAHQQVGLQTRAADAITRFAGSMPFVYAHIVWFALWIVLAVEAFPFGLLTMIVSLEAIFLATFVMVSQNRQAAFAEAKANHDFTVQQALLEQNTDLTREIHAVTVNGNADHIKKRVEA